MTKVDRAFRCSMLIRRGRRPPFFTIVRGAADPPYARVLAAISIFWFAQIAHATTLDAVMDQTLAKTMSAIVIGEHRPLACSVRRLAERIRTLTRHVEKSVRGKLPRTARQRRALPRSRPAVLVE